MAITILEYELLAHLKKQGLLQPNGSILELGEANWYGDVAPQRFKDDIKALVPEQQQELLDRFDELIAGDDPYKLFKIAKIFYRVFFNYGRLDAIDLDGTDHAMKLDLNEPVQLDQQYDFVMNDGTGEHVFNVYQFFKTIHEVTRPGGIMFHGMPFSGWVDHGFYNFNPTFYWDLVAANRYELLFFAYGELNPPKINMFPTREAILEFAKNDQIGKNSLLYLACRKPSDEQPFVSPMQGYYARTLSAHARDGWLSMR